MHKEKMEGKVGHPNWQCKSSVKVKSTIGLQYLIQLYCHVMHTNKSAGMSSKT